MRLIILVTHPYHHTLITSPDMQQEAAADFRYTLSAEAIIVGRTLSHGRQAAVCHIFGITSPREMQA